MAGDGRGFVLSWKGQMISFLSEYVGSIFRKGVHFTTVEVSVLVICIVHFVLLMSLIGGGRSINLHIFTYIIFFPPSLVLIFYIKKHNT